MRKSLEKLSVATTMDRAFDLYRSHFSQFFRLSLAIVAPYSVLGAIAALVLVNNSVMVDPATPNQNLDAALDQLASLAIPILIILVGSAVAFAASAHLTAEAYLGRPNTWTKSLSCGLRSFFRLAGAGVAWSILLMLAYFTAAVPVGIVFAIMLGAGAATGGTGAAGVVFTVLIAFVLLFVFAVAFATGSFLPQLVALEGGGPLNSISRNWKLFSPQPLRLGLSVAIQLLAVQLISVAISQSIQTATQMLVTMGHLPTVITNVVTVLISVVVAVLWQPFVCAWLTIVYFDRRVRLEGYDVTLATFAVQNSPIPPPMPVRAA